MIFSRIIIPKDTFRELNIPLNAAQMRDLEKRIKKGNSVEPIPVWNNQILDGYERFELCEKYHKGYRVTDMYFIRMHEAVAWICRQQLNRKDLHRQAVCWLIYRLYKALLEGERQKAARDQFQYRMLSPSLRSSQESAPETENTALLKAIGDEYGYHRSTIRSYVRYGRQLDRLEEMFPGVRLRILKGEIEAPIIYLDAVMQIPMDELGQMISNPRCRELLPPEEIRKKILAARGTKQKEEIRINAGIKEMPAYDPDAELNRLTYTVGTWSKTIRRTGENADFRNATWKGRENLYRALRALAMDMKNLSDKLEALENE